MQFLFVIIVRLIYALKNKEEKKDVRVDENMPLFNLLSSTSATIVRISFLPFSIDRRGFMFVVL